MFSDNEVMTTESDSFLPLVEELCHANAVPANAPVIITRQPMTSKPMKWIEIGFPHSTMPEQGWKLHISAQYDNSVEVLKRVVPILVHHQVPWKCAPSLRHLQGLNQGEGGATQVGKFITVYPLTDAQSVALARALEEVTQGLEGPAVPTDRSLTPDSLVHYRYGAFRNMQFQLPTGRIIQALRRSDGQYVEDKRTMGFLPPPTLADPFEAAGLYVAPPPPKKFYGGRFLHISTIYQAARNKVHLTMDLQQGCRAIVKQVSLKSRVGLEGEKAANLVRREAEVLQSMAHDARFPKFYALFESDNSLFLAMEDLQSVTLEQFIGEFRTRHVLPHTADVARWGCRLASMLNALHTCGWIHRDLKSTNVLVSADEQLRLIDFDISVRVGSETRNSGFGTRGYQSRQQIAGAFASVQDDIYGLGALLYFVVTLTESSQAPNVDNLLERPIALLNPQIHPSLCSVIERCLAHDLSERYATVAEVEHDLAALCAVVDQPLQGNIACNNRAQHLQAVPRFEQAALRLADSLLEVAHPVLGGEGLVWSSEHRDGAGMRSREINTGTGGTLYALTEFADKVSAPSYRDAVARGARWLAVAPRLNDAIVPGLYVGEAGIATALLRAGQVLNDDALVASALIRANEVANAPLTSPDLFNGAAGRLRMHLWAWHATQDATQLAHANAAGEFLLRPVEGTHQEEAYWTIPQGFDGLSSQAELGYAHGTAGIADALLDWYEATGDVRIRDVVARSTRWLIRQGVEVFEGAGLAWPRVAHQGDGPVVLRSGFWCHGAAGIGLLLTRVAHQGWVPDALDAAMRSAYAVAFGTRWSTPTLCHGLAGNIDFLLTLYQTTGDATVLGYAYTLGTILEAFVQRTDTGQWVTPSESALMITPDYMVGYAGVAVTLLRLTQPDTFRHPFRDATLTTRIPTTVYA